MQHNPISPLDGRYANLLEDVARFGSEQALVEARARVELAWLTHLLPAIDADTDLIAGASRFAAAMLAELEQDATAFFVLVKEHEAVTNHDVKALEYALADKAQQCLGHNALASWIHFSLTSEDVNNLAWNLVANNLREHCLLPLLTEVIAALCDIAEEGAEVPMLSRTHGQPASPTTIGKEIAVFADRLTTQIAGLQSIAFTAKISGAVGAYNAMATSYPEVDWRHVSRDVIESLGCKQIPISTQIEPHDTLAGMLYSLATICGVLTDMSRDFWHYISLDYIGLRTVKKEIGSSTMPHKVNPIHFENAEGNLGVATALAQHLAGVLQTSRLQRDLCDSTRLRNLPSVFGYICLALQQLKNGIGRLRIQNDKLASDLDQHWQVLAEPVMILLRKAGRSDGYEVVKAESRGMADWGKADYERLVEKLALDEDTAKRARELTPGSYTGIAAQIAFDTIASCRAALPAKKGG